MDKYNPDRPNTGQKLYPMVDTIREMLNLLRRHESATSFPIDPDIEPAVNGIIIYRPDIDGGSFFGMAGGLWVQLWSVDNGFNQDAEDTAFSHENIEGDSVYAGMDYIYQTFSLITEELTQDVEELEDQLGAMLVEEGEDFD